MEKTDKKRWLNDVDSGYIKALKSGDNELSRRFFYEEIAGTIHRIRTEVFRGLVEFDEMVNELYLYLSKDNWTKLDGFDGKNNCRLRIWMIPVAWRFFLNSRQMTMNLTLFDDEPRHENDPFEDELRIQIAIDVNSVLSKMPNKRYAEIIKLLLIHGYSASNVAEMLDMKIENVYNLKHQAVNQFIEIYGM